MSANIKITILVTFHSIKAKVRKLCKKSFVADISSDIDVECPDLPLNTFIHIKNFFVGTQFNSISSSHLVCQQYCSSIRINAPEFACAFLPIRIRSKELVPL